jgi:hypothetical protein
VPFYLLVEERSGNPAHAAQPQKPVVRHIAHDVAWFIDPTPHEASRLARTERADDVADAIARRAGQQLQQRVGEAALVAGDGGHRGEAEGKGVVLGGP